MKGDPSVKVWCREAGAIDRGGFQEGRRLRPLEEGLVAVLDLREALMTDLPRITDSFSAWWVPGQLPSKTHRSAALISSQNPEWSH